MKEYFTYVLFSFVVLTVLVGFIFGLVTLFIKLIQSVGILLAFLVLIILLSLILAGTCYVSEGE